MMTESVSVTVQPGNSQPAGSKDGRLAGLKLSPLYFRTIPGMLKLAQLILGIICMALGGHGWYMFVCAAAFVITLIWCVIYFFSVRESLSLPINWILTELLNTAIWTVLYFTAFIVQITTLFHWGVYVAGAVFCILNTLIYAAGAYFLYLEYKN
ncbi:plasmolipin isoform X1 [Phymastichus coffea]|uniref:plasmolipin isoform X1 n=1 Tax=Phymastichus coffea TaxID=108790 RepID=UPI00273B949D|nr:plasmolipin isoform X1 [Phymastichus coffea]